mgnify:CR=1 FL=1
MTLRAAVLVFPGSNCDRDLAVALRRAGAEVAMVWHKEASLPAGGRGWRASRPGSALRSPTWC